MPACTITVDIPRLQKITHGGGRTVYRARLGHRAFVAILYSLPGRLSYAVYTGAERTVRGWSEIDGPDELKAKICDLLVDLKLRDREWRTALAERVNRTDDEAP